MIGFWNHSSIRDIAQLGRAPALGAGCRRFKSYYPETYTNLIYLRNTLTIASFFPKTNVLNRFSSLVLTSKEIIELLMEFNLFSILFICKSELLTDYRFIILCIINLILIQTYK